MSFYPLPPLPPTPPAGVTSGPVFDEWYWRLQYFNAQINAVRAEAEQACAANQAALVALQTAKPTKSALAWDLIRAQKDAALFKSGHVVNGALQAVEAYAVAFPDAVEAPAPAPTPAPIP